MRGIIDKTGVKMDLTKYDDRPVRITYKDGELFEGICQYNNAEYCELELGRAEESLEIINFLFYKSDIKKVEIIEMFSAPYGKIEEYYLDEGIDCMDDVWYCDNDEHTVRMLNCIEEKIKAVDFPYRAEITAALKKLTEYTQNEQIKERAKALIEACKKEH